MIDMGQYDAVKTVTGLPDEKVFSNHRARVERMRLASYIADYVMEEQSRGNLEVDKWMIADALDAYEGGTK